MRKEDMIVGGGWFCVEIRSATRQGDVLLPLHEVTESEGAREEEENSHDDSK